MSDATIRGRFVWHELMTTDIASAGTFFNKVIGWKTEPFGNDGFYTLFMAGRRQAAGLMLLPEEARKMGAPAMWLTYIGTPNVDETAKQVVALGGKIHKAPEDIPTVGRFAVVQDPQGATFGIYTPKSGPGPEAAPEVGDFSWHELATTDWRAALSFYQKLFGWDETSAMDMGEMGTYQMYGRNGRTLGGMMTKPKEMPGPSAWTAYIRIPDAKKTAEAVKRAGGKILHGPVEVPGGDWIVNAMDPQGAMFAVHSLKPAAAKAAPAAPAKKATKSGAKASARKAAKSKPAKKKSAKAVKRPVAKKRGAAKQSTAKKSKSSSKGSKKTAGRRTRAGKKR